MTIGCEYNIEPVSETSQNKNTRYCLCCTYNKDGDECNEFVKRTNGKLIIGWNGWI